MTKKKIPKGKAKPQKPKVSPETRKLLRTLRSGSDSDRRDAAAEIVSAMMERSRKSKD